MSVFKTIVKTLNKILFKICDLLIMLKQSAHISTDNFLYMIRNEKQIDNNNNDKKKIFIILNWNCVCHLCFAYIVDPSLLANIVQPVPSDWKWLPTVKHR